MSAIPDSTLAASEQLIADLQRQLAECRAEHAGRNRGAAMRRGDGAYLPPRRRFMAAGGEFWIFSGICGVLARVGRGSLRRGVPACRLEMRTRSPASACS